MPTLDRDEFMLIYVAVFGASSKASLERVRSTRSAASVFRVYRSTSGVREIPAKPRARSKHSVRRVRTRDLLRQCLTRSRSF